MGSDSISFIWYPRKAISFIWFPGKEIIKNSLLKKLIDLVYLEKELHY